MSSFLHLPVSSAVRKQSTTMPLRLNPSSIASSKTNTFSTLCSSSSRLPKPRKSPPALPVPSHRPSHHPTTDQGHTENHLTFTDPNPRNPPPTLQSHTSSSDPTNPLLPGPDPPPNASPSPQRAHHHDLHPPALCRRLATHQPPLLHPSYPFESIPCIPCYESRRYQAADEGSKDRGGFGRIKE